MKRGVLALFLVVLGGFAEALEAGAAKVDITPPLGTPLNGYLDRWGRGAIAVHDPIWARCLYLSDADTSVFLVSADLCVINGELRDRVIELAPSVLPKENVILVATHNHSGQGAMIKPLLFRSIAGRFMPEVLEMTAQGFAEAMRNAYANRRRAAIGHGIATREDLSRNRRFPDGPTDPQIGVVRVEDSDGIPIVILANFAAHPTTVGDKDVLTVSADYPGYYYTELERLAPPGCVAMFTNGAEGNQTCGNPEHVQSWDRTASIGRLLARRVYEAAERVACTEAEIHFARATPGLPPTIAGSFMPASTVLQTLEIGDLLLTFFPGEPCVEIGLEMRRRALERGYRGQFTVALANDHLMYFVPRSLYSKLIYESGMNFYGPRIEDWFYDEFSKLMTRGAPEPDRTPPDAIEPESFPGGYLLRLEGAPYEQGYGRAAAFRAAIRQAYERDVIGPCVSGALIPDTGLWRLAPSFLDLTLLALVRLGIGVRPLLEGLPEPLFVELEGFAEGAGLPFDAAWLMHCASTYADRENIQGLYRAPFCTMLAAVGERAGADDLLVGRNFDWSEEDAVVLTTQRSEGGVQFLSIGFPWSIGAFGGMNEAGVVVCAERDQLLGEPFLEGLPVELVVRMVLGAAAGFEDAVVAVRGANLQGYRILVAGPVAGASPAGRGRVAAAAWAACVVECGPEPLERRPVDGLLFGCDPSSASRDEGARARYARLAELLGGERIVAVEEIQEALRDSGPGPSDREGILNDRTRYSAVFVPNSRRLYLSARQSDGVMGTFQEFSLGKGAR